MCERWDKSRGLWVKLQETNYLVFVSGFLEDLNAKLPYLYRLDHDSLLKHTCGHSGVYSPVMEMDGDGRISKLQRGEDDDAQGFWRRRHCAPRERAR
jgi:hypothetical protein